MTDKHQCEKQVHDGSRWSSFHQCTRNGKNEHDGKWYCKQHYPPEIERKAQERLDKYDAGWEKKRERAAEKDRLIEQGKKLDTLRAQVENLKAIAQENCDICKSDSEHRSLNVWESRRDTLKCVLDLIDDKETDHDSNK